MPKGSWTSVAPRAAHAIIRSVVHVPLPAAPRTLPCSMVQPFYPRMVSGTAVGGDADRTTTTTTAATTTTSSSLHHPHIGARAADGTSAPPRAVPSSLRRARCPVRCDVHTPDSERSYVFVGGPPGHGTTALYALLSSSPRASNLCGFVGPLCEGGYVVARRDGAHRSGAMWTHQWAARVNWTQRALSRFRQVRLDNKPHEP